MTRSAHPATDSPRCQAPTTRGSLGTGQAARESAWRQDLGPDVGEADEVAVPGDQVVGPDAASQRDEVVVVRVG